MSGNGFDEARSAVRPSLLEVRWLGTHHRKSPRSIALQQYIALGAA